MSDGPYYALGVVYDRDKRDWVAWEWDSSLETHGQSPSTALHALADVIAEEYEPVGRVTDDE